MKITLTVDDADIDASLKKALDEAVANLVRGRIEAVADEYMKRHADNIIPRVSAQMDAMVGRKVNARIDTILSNGKWNTDGGTTSKEIRTIFKELIGESFANDYIDQLIKAQTSQYTDDLIRSKLNNDLAPEYVALLTKYKNMMSAELSKMVKL